MNEHDETPTKAPELPGDDAQLTGAQHDFLRLLAPYLSPSGEGVAPSPTVAGELPGPSAKASRVPRSLDLPEAESPASSPPVVPTPSPLLPALEGDLSADSPGLTCVLLGPTGAGKTCLLAALDAACSAESSELPLATVWDRHNGDADLLLQQGHAWIATGAAPPATNAAMAYSVELTLGLGARGIGANVTSLRCIDEAGAQLFPPPRHVPSPVDATAAQALPVAGRRRAEISTATAIAFVVDATSPCAATIEDNLAALLDRIASARPSERSRHGGVSGLLMRIGLRRAPVDPRRTRLSIKRLLLLLTKVDALADRAARSLRAAGERVSALAVARSLDPLGLAHEVVGARCLRRLHRALGLNASFAIGVCSASGFCDRGEAFERWSRGRTADERVRAWTPFGVAEALRFLADGSPGATLHVVCQSDLIEDDVVALDHHVMQGAR